MKKLIIISTLFGFLSRRWLRQVGIPIIIASGILSFGFFNPSHAAPMTGGGYKIPDLVISGGGHPSMEGGNYKTHDLKGQTVIGVSSGGDYTVYLGGIFTLGGAVVTGNWPDGTCPLYISRQGSDINITWEAAIKNPKIYMLTGDGTGQYVNGPSSSWTLIVENGALVGGLPQPLGTFSGNIANGQLIHESQIGQGHMEEYFKCLQDGYNPEDPNADPSLGTNFEAAWADGKININIGAGMNVVSMPFDRQDNGIADVLHTDLLTVGDYIYYKPLSHSPNTEKATIVGSDWKDDLNNNSTIKIYPTYGYWLKAQAPKTLTVWGNVVNAASREVMIKDDGILVIGTVYPKQSLFLAVGLDTAGAARQGDAVYYKPLASSPNTQKVTFDGSNWSGSIEDRRFTLPFGYWYKRKLANGDFQYKHLRPW